MGTVDATKPQQHVRRHPEKDVLYRVIHQYFPSFREHLQQDPRRRTPRFVLREFEKFLDCGVLARGFARVRFLEAPGPALLP